MRFAASARWTRLLGSGTAPLDPAAASSDGKALCCFRQCLLRAFALADGQPLWQNAAWHQAKRSGGLS